MVGLGHAELADGEGRVTVVETLTCAHCSAIYRKPAVGEISGFCTMCMKPVCVVCGSRTTCDPFERKLERLESKDRLLRSL